MTRQVTPQAEAEQDSPLAAMISAIRDGEPLTALDRARIRVLMVDQALERGLSWAMIATASGYPSGRQAKKIIHDLKVRVQREMRLQQNREQLRAPGGGPYVHEYAAPESPEERYVPYTMTGPGVVDVED